MWAKKDSPKPPTWWWKCSHPPITKKLREQKKQVYADFGVREYWEIQPSASRIRIETLVQTEEDGWAYALFSEAEGQGQVRSQVLEGFTLSLGQVFPEVEVPAGGAKSLG
ncbi:MAG: Uma2 family endonuclease [Microscillaceae bacterium]|nr:Uma2 family endonuclease [Microscillaceae bacterium]